MPGLIRNQTGNIIEQEDQYFPQIEKNQQNKEVDREAKRLHVPFVQVQTGPGQ
jgi:hypothetical protein